MIVLASLAGLLLLVPFHDLVRGRSLRRVAFRNIARRPSEAALVVFGGMLGTAIIVAAFIVGDTFDHSIRDIARTDLGPIDQVVELADPADAPAALAALTGTEWIAGVDGVASVNMIEVALATVADNPKAEPSGTLIGIDLEDALRFGSDPVITGLADVPSLGAGELALNEQVARTIGATVGDAIEVYAYGSAHAFTVVDVTPDIGLAGYSAAIVNAEELATIAATADRSAKPPSASILISNDGGVFDSTEEPLSQLPEADRRLDEAGIAHEQFAVKADLLIDAEQEGAGLRETFIVVGGFSVIAGVLLLVNLFVMLAEERKTTLGVFRALGWQRRRLVRSFALEGSVYALLAAVAGTVLGIGVGRVIMIATQRIFNGSGDDFTLRFAVEPRSLLTAALVGLVISMLAIWFTSYRVGRLNIIRAIRDLPEPASTQRSRRTMLVGIAGVSIGAATFALAPSNAFAVLAGPCLASFSAIPLLGRVVSKAFATLVGGGLAIAWAVASFTVRADAMSDPDIGIFLLQGVILVAGAVAVLSVAGPLWRRMLTGLRGRRGPAVRLGVAYPVARGFRTSLSLAMFSLILFSLTFIGAMGSVYAGQADDLVGGIDSGRDVLLDSNATDPVSAEALLTIDGVENVVGVARGWASIASSRPDQNGTTEWALTGIDASFTEVGSGLGLVERDSAFASDAAAFDAVAADPALAIVPSWFFDEGELEPQPGEHLTLFGDDGKHDLTIVGVLDSDLANAGVVVSEDLALQARPTVVAFSRYYIDVANTHDASTVAATISAAFITSGADAETFRSIVDTEISTERGFFNLLSGYLGLGLIIGIAGLSVVMIRAVRERRAQIGTLRAVGMVRSTVRTVFLTESTFIALQGVVSGVLLGLLSSYQVLTNGGLFPGEPSFVVPFGTIAIIALAPLGFAAVAAAWPANRAARLRPADALRLGE